MGVKINSNKKFLPSRLKEARESRGLTMRELADLINANNHQIVSKYENGKSIPPAEVLMRIMSELKFPYDFFFSEEIDENREESVVYFRSRAKATAKLKKIHQIKISWLSRIYSYLDQVIEFPEINVPNYGNDHSQFFKTTSNNQIENIAKKLREHWNLNNGPITDMTHLLEKNGVIISAVKSDLFTIDACSKWINKNLFILVGNEKASASRIKFTLAHELGHSILHKNIKSEDFNKSEVYKRIEREANYFASAFLLPAESISKELISHSLDYYVLLKKRWQVSIQAMIYRSNDLNLITDFQTSYLWKQIAKKGWRIKEPLDDELVAETPNLIKEAIELIVDHHVETKQQLVQEIKLNPLDIEVISGLTPGYFNKINLVPNNVIKFKK